MTYKGVIAVVAMLVFSGCASQTDVAPPKKTIYIKRSCPKFNVAIDIKVEDLNSTHAAILWTDVAQIESMVSEKKKYNKKIDKLNNT
ncbi:MAG: hypothetical protein U9R12_03480 [Candidatus Caldatribacteriota bacterium]|nr:hypothetical protein [Candidatus Caldatribacteriota bacterium]